MTESEIARLEQGIEACLTLEYDFADLESGFTVVPSKIPAASRRFRTKGWKGKPHYIPSGQNRTTVHASD
ncbi:hypothetical protein [Paenibacillus contaminans]|uniref:Uncharacterized protein n=1 Tax=Paenibacillus contaminans TaxID=450362 RepID=A0A329MSG2_9BACL|nr:hypothetical protein [Paenibacillus contaminans]RAV20897.1 hypothetical protein DQG23_12450 [Paenibacillus contaminans]